MIRKLFLVAALVAATVASNPTPAPAIDFICTCQVCAGGSGPGCRDLKTGRFTSCSLWWASHSSHC
jgi:hypothetical protein